MNNLPTCIIVPPGLVLRWAQEFNPAENDKSLFRRDRPPPSLLVLATSEINKKLPPAMRYDKHYWGKNVDDHEALARHLNDHPTDFVLTSSTYALPPPPQFENQRLLLAAARFGRVGVDEGHAAVTKEAGRRDPPDPALFPHAPDMGRFLLTATPLTNLDTTTELRRFYAIAFNRRDNTVDRSDFCFVDYGDTTEPLVRAKEMRRPFRLEDEHRPWYLALGLYPPPNDAPGDRASFVFTLSDKLVQRPEAYAGIIAEQQRLRADATAVPRQVLGTGVWPLLKKDVLDLLLKGKAKQRARLDEVAKAVRKRLASSIFLPVREKEVPRHGIILFSGRGGADSNWPSMLFDAIKKKCLKKFGQSVVDAFLPLYYTGANDDSSLKDFDKEMLKARDAKDAKSAVFLFSTYTAGGTGLNLQLANTIIFVDQPLTAILLEQARARALRIGQTADRVEIFSLVCAESEEDLYRGDRLAQKRAVARDFQVWTGVLLPVLA